MYPSGPPPAEIRPKVMWIWIGAGLMVLAFALSILLFVLQLTGLQSTLNALDRVPSGSTVTLDLDSGTYSVYVEDHGRANVIVSSPSGDIPVRTPSTSETYDFGDFHASVRGTFDVEEAGPVAVTNNGFDAVRVGEPVVGQLISTVLIPFAVGAVLGITGLVILIITLVRRSQAKKRVVMAGGLGGPRGPVGPPGPGGPMGTGGGYGPGGGFAPPPQ